MKRLSNSSLILSALTFLAFTAQAIQLGMALERGEREATVLHTALGVLFSIGHAYAIERGQGGDE